MSAERRVFVGTDRNRAVGDAALVEGAQNVLRKHSGVAQGQHLILRCGWQIERVTPTTTAQPHNAFSDSTRKRKTSVESPAGRFASTVENARGGDARIHGDGVVDGLRRRQGTVHVQLAPAANQNKNEKRKRG